MLNRDVMHIVRQRSAFVNTGRSPCLPLMESGREICGLHMAHLAGMLLRNWSGQE